MMYIKIDYREKELYKKCMNLWEMISGGKTFTLVQENLPIGDIILNDGKSDLLIIERKTLNDLAASIVDGRYEEQSYRLGGLNHHNHNVAYLIEGDLTKYVVFKEKMDKLTLYSIIISLFYYKGFSVLRSVSLDETATIICNMAAKIEKETNRGRESFYSNNVVCVDNTYIPKGSEASIQATPTPKPLDYVLPDEAYIIQPQNLPDEVAIQQPLKQPVPQKNVQLFHQQQKQLMQEQSEKDYCSVIKKVKKENVTESNISEIMLCQIPGVSSATALAIFAKHKDMATLIKNLDEDEKCLDDVCTTDGKGKSRKISKTCIANIVKFLKSKA
jgi:ERCC4-type nuclease